MASDDNSKSPPHLQVRLPVRIAQPLQRATEVARHGGRVNVGMGVVPSGEALGVQPTLTNQIQVMQTGKTTYDVEGRLLR